MSVRTALATFVVTCLAGALVHEHARMSGKLLEIEGTKAAEVAQLRRELAETKELYAEARRSQEILRGEVADVRRAAEGEAASTRTELLDLHRRLAAGTEADPAGGGATATKRALQADDELCLDPNSVAVVALDMAHSANEELGRLRPVIGGKANASDVDDMRARLEDFASALSTATGQAVGPEETLACTCAICAEPLAGGGICAPWEAGSECECVVPGDTESGAPVRQSFPVTQADPECCRAEYLETVTVTQMRVQSEYDPTVYNEVYDQDEVIIKIDGQVTFSFSGFENVEQTDSS